MKTRIPEAERSDSLRHYHKHRERESAAARERMRKTRAESKEEWRLYMREYRFRKLYGIGVSDYDAILASQGGICAICKTDRPGGKGGHFGVFCVDHDHATGVVRGILCNACNAAVGGFGDSVDVLRAAVAYLERPAILVRA